MKAWVGLLLLGGCFGPQTVGSLTASGTGGTAAGDSETAGPMTTTTISGSAGMTTGSASTGGGTSVDSEDADSSESSDGTKLDIEVPDPVSLPQTCAAAQDAESTVGCEFFAQDLGDLGLAASWSIIVSNVRDDGEAHVTFERRVDGQWVEEHAATVDPRDLHVFDPVNMNIVDTVLLQGTAYRVRSDVPVVAYQINPAEGGSDSGDASMLLPVSSWDTRNAIVGWDNGTAIGMVYLTVVAAVDNTTVRVTPSVATRASAGGEVEIPALAPGESHLVDMQAGDTLAVFAANSFESLTGTEVISLDDNEPVGVFSGARCVNIPSGVSACDHIETQLSGVQQWGNSFAATRVPARDAEDPEPSVWHVYARYDDTVLQFEAEDGVDGLPPTGMATLQAGEHLELWVDGTAEHPGDFFIDSTQPIAVVNYMTGADNLPLDFFPNPPGDPAMVQVLPVAQFMPIYVVLVPPGWESDFLVVTRQAGEAVSLDGAPVDDGLFYRFAPNWEVARVPVGDGVHVLESEDGFGVEVVGYEDYDSYAYAGGGQTAVINPEG